MTLLHEAFDAKKFDSRVTERNITRGVAKAEEFQKSVKDLPDDSANAEWVSIQSLAEGDGEDSPRGH